VALNLTASTRRAFDRLGQDLLRVLGSRFVALVASSETASVAFASTIEAGDLDALGALVESWHHEQLETPLLLTPDELRRSLDAFPLEYQALIERHIVIAGTPPFAGLTVHHVYLRQACEVEAKGHLIHLRQAWLEAAGHDERLADVMAASAAPLRTLLANVARLDGGDDSLAADPDQAALEGARLAGLDVSLVRNVLAFGSASAPAAASDASAQMPAYLAAAESLWVFVDQWQRP
jgi:hypothetical protein